ncbi:MAG TPA: glycosyltransferase, partial [archaeon]|nr:glycosyltransferase [archaeon]
MINTKASIIILNWNTSADTIECIDSLKNQTEKNFEVIVVDNASEPEDVNKLKEYCAKEKFLKIQLILNRENIGFTGGNNSALKPAKGEIVVSLNNDAVAESEWLEKLLEPFSDPLVGGTGS